MKERTVKIISWILFWGYICVLVYFMFFAEIWGRTSICDEYSYNLIPFKEIIRFIKYRKQLGTVAVLTNIGGNIVGFMPFGFILPILSPKTRGIFRILILTFDLSLCIEMIQLVSKVGCCDVDDMILNTLGGVLGYIAFYIFNAVRRSFFGKRFKVRR